MNPAETRMFGLWTIKGIKRFKKALKPDFVGSIISDLQVGAKNALALPEFTCLDGTEVTASMDSCRIYYEAWQPWIEFQKAWKVEVAFILGDLVSALAKSGVKGMDFIDIQNSKEMLVLLLQYYTEILTLMISGTPIHDSLDTFVHKDVADRIGAEFVDDGYIQGNFAGVICCMGHKVRSGAQFPLGVMEKNTGFSAQGAHVGKVPDASLIVGGHWHKYDQVTKNGITEVICPGWQIYYPYRGSIVYHGKNQPDVGGLIWLVKDNRSTIIPYLFEVQTMKQNIQYETKAKQLTRLQ